MSDRYYPRKERFEVGYHACAQVKNSDAGWLFIFDHQTRQEHCRWETHRGAGYYFEQLKKANNFAGRLNGKGANRERALRKIGL